MTDSKKNIHYVKQQSSQLILAFYNAFTSIFSIKIFSHNSSKTSAKDAPKPEILKKLASSAGVNPI